MDQTLTISVSMMAIVIILRCPVGDLNSLVNVGWGIMANDVRKSPLVFRFKCVSIDCGAAGWVEGMGVFLKDLWGRKLFDEL
jgi:hypothetical protein